MSRHRGRYPASRRTTFDLSPSVRSSTVRGQRHLPRLFIVNSEQVSSRRWHPPFCPDHQTPCYRFPPSQVPASPSRINRVSSARMNQGSGLTSRGWLSHGDRRPHSRVDQCRCSAIDEMIRRVGPPRIILRRSRGRQGFGAGVRPLSSDSMPHSGGRYLGKRIARNHPCTLAISFSCGCAASVFVDNKLRILAVDLRINPPRSIACLDRHNTKSW